MDLFVFFFVWTIFNTLFVGIGLPAIFVLGIPTAGLVPFGIVVFGFIFNCIMFFIMYFKFGKQIQKQAKSFMSPAPAQ